MLSPNALRVLDSVGAYERLRSKGFNFDIMTFMTDVDHKPTGTYYFGHEGLYGYKALRIHRSVIISELRIMVAEQGTTIDYGKKFSHVISEGQEGVRYAFTDGTEDVAEILIGADGIHSKVREYVLPDIKPVYSGFLGVTYAFPASNLRIPSEQDYTFPITFQGKNGSFVMALQKPDGKEMFVGRQFKHSMQNRSGWDALLKEKTELISMHQKDKSEWSDIVQSAQEQLDGDDAHSLNIWPFHTVPKLEKWSSAAGKVIIIGDAAHAIPPTAGQGANQAFEDSYSLAFLLKSLGPGLDLQSGLKAWYQYRLERVQKVLVLSDQMNSLRLTEDEKKYVPLEKLWRDQSEELGEGQQFAWLYSNSIDMDMAKVLGHI